MRLFKFSKILINLILVAILFTACGYRPSAKHSREVVGNSISTSVVISAVDPENTVIIKDAVDGAIIEVFHTSLVSKEISDTHLVLTLHNPSYSAIEYDRDGYVITYRANISLGIVATTKEFSKSYTAKGTYDFRIAPNAIISDKDRYNAIKNGAIKAIKSFVAQVSAEGARAKKEKENSVDNNSTEIE